MKKLTIIEIRYVRRNILKNYNNKFSGRFLIFPKSNPKKCKLTDVLWFFFLRCFKIVVKSEKIRKKNLV